MLFPHLPWIQALRALPLFSLTPGRKKYALCYGAKGIILANKKLVKAAETRSLQRRLDNLLGFCKVFLPRVDHCRIKQ